MATTGGTVAETGPSPSALAGPVAGFVQAAGAARILGARTVVPTHTDPTHTEGWQHLSEGPVTVTETFARSGQQGQLLLLAPGEAAELP
jgi:L-ascorbate metabolism protein UlaG (beta-lactamase superfamily)